MHIVTTEFPILKHTKIKLRKVFPKLRVKTRNLADFEQDNQ